MHTSSKKTYRTTLIFTFALMLTITLLVSFELANIYQKQTQPVESAPIYVKEIETAESYSDEDNVLITEQAQTESIRSEESDVEQENDVLAVDTHQSETERSCAEETIVETNDPPSSEQTCTVGEFDSLFIGDSRTMGLADYASIENANFFSAIGMSVYNVLESRVSIPQIGKVTLEELLNYKQYDIVYVMLGINELGYAFEKTVACYGKLVETVMQSQPDAVVILMANIHVTSKRSETDKYINNPAIDRFNEATAQLADNETVFYLDANSLFDDADGNLAEEKSADSAHLKAKYYVQWADWLEVKTAEIILRAEGEKDD